MATKIHTRYKYCIMVILAEFHEFPYWLMFLMQIRFPAFNYLELIIMCGVTSADFINHNFVTIECDIYNSGYNIIAFCTSSSMLCYKATTIAKFYNKDV